MLRRGNRAPAARLCLADPGGAPAAPPLPLEAEAAPVRIAGSASARSAASLGDGRLQPPSSGLEGLRPCRASGLAPSWRFAGGCPTVDSSDSKYSPAFPNFSALPVAGLGFWVLITCSLRPGLGLLFSSFPNSRVLFWSQSTGSCSSPRCLWRRLAARQCRVSLARCDA